MKHLLTFSNLPNATTGVFLPKENWLITGHQNGLVIKWDLTKNALNQLHRCPSVIETISCANGKKIVVGSHVGDLLVIDLENPARPEIIQEATYSVHSRVWRTFSPRTDSLVMTSTYGVMNLLRKENSQWEKVPLAGHWHSIFGLDGYNDKLMASGDYRGNILIWEPKETQYTTIQRLKVNQGLQDIAWHQDETFVAIDRSGHVYLFEKLEGDGERWQLVFEVDSATSFGRCIHITEDGKTVLAGTNDQIIQLDRDTQQVGLINIKGTRKIFSEGNSIFVLTTGGFRRFERKEVKVQPGFIKYRYAKVSLVGHTGVGKSTLCNFITTGSGGKMKSTFGKRVWTWAAPSDGKLERRVVFHDHGGQETVLGTFLPLLADSDIVLILFQRTDKTTFTTALETLEQLRENLGTKTKIFFVQTFIDHDVRDFDENLLKKIIDEKRIDGHFEVCPPDGRGIDHLKKQLMDGISWENARIMIQSEYTRGAIETISRILEKDVNVIAFEDLKKHYKETSGLKIPVRHLKFLLRDLSNQGIIDYYPEASNLIIINDKEFNRLRTNVPIFVEKANGVVSLDQLRNTFDNEEYLSILDSIYQNYRITVKNRDLRIFPEKLRTEQISVPEPYSTILKSIPEPEEKFLQPQKIGISRLIEALSELNLRCVDASQTDGLFSWGEMACVYYIFQTIGDAIRGYQVKCTSFIGGKKKESVDRLKKEFESIIGNLYGPFIAEISNHFKKKEVLSRNTKFDVALSFAGEQRDFAKRVFEILSSKGIKCFYDEFYRAQLWGTNLAEYLHNVYYSQSNYCIMFISEDYVSKAWPTHERRSAIAKQIELANVREYILPVVFDDSEVPGLQLSAIGYLDARKEPPEKIAGVFLQKLKYEEDS